LQTQWRVGARGATGIDYMAMIALANLMAIEITPTLFIKISRLEDITLKHWAEHA